MFNLLPDSLKEKIKTEYYLRFWTVTIFTLIFVEAAFLIFIFPSWLVSSYRENDLSSQVEKGNQSKLKNGAYPIIGQIGEINSKLDILNTFMRYPSFNPFVEIVVGNKLSAIRLTGLLFSREDNSKARLVVEGRSDTREDLVAFVKNIKDTGKFSLVDLPVSNLAKDKNIDFSLNLDISE